MLTETTLKLASSIDIEKLDTFLGELTLAQGTYLSPWRVAQKTAVSQPSVIETFLAASQKGLLSIRFEVWCPETRIKIFESFDKAEIQSQILCDRCSPEKVHEISDSDVHLSFRLNEESSTEGTKKKSPSNPVDLH